MKLRGLINLASLWRRPKPKVGVTPQAVVFRENKWSLIRYLPKDDGPKFKTPILLVPSLINRHYVLDLMPGKSFAEFLVNAGHDVYVIDWGTPGDEDRFLSFDDVCDRYIGRALRQVARTSERNKAHLLGYCLGGTLTSIFAAVRQEHIASLTAIAAPVRFKDTSLLSSWANSKSFDVQAMIDAYGNVPWPLMQAAFHMLRPTLMLWKGVHLLDKAWDDEYLNGFIALETWGNDNVSFPGECYRRYFEALYKEDALIDDSFYLSGELAKLSNIRCPTLAVTFEHDNIVPHQSASVLLDRISSTDKERIHLIGGHVGAMVSSSAAKSLWPKISAWWAARDRDPVILKPAKKPIRADDSEKTRKRATPTREA